MRLMVATEESLNKKTLVDCSLLIREEVETGFHAMQSRHFRNHIVRQDEEMKIEIEVRFPHV